VEEPVEGVRNAEDGTKRDLGTPRWWTPPTDVAKREEDPKEGAPTGAAVGRTRSEGTLKRSESSGEDEAVDAKRRRRTAREEEPKRRSGNGSNESVTKNPMTSLVARTQNSGEPATS